MDLKLKEWRQTGPKAPAALENAQAHDTNLTLARREAPGASMDGGACIGCGACVAACPNGAAQLFTSAKLAHLNLMPQGQPERAQRTVAMVETMETYFGSCTNHQEC